MRHGKGSRLVEKNNYMYDDTARIERQPVYYYTTVARELKIKM